MSCKSLSLVIATLFACFCGPSTNADDIHYTLEAYDNGTFKIFTEVIGNDSNGLDQYAMTFHLGNTTHIQHESPLMQFNQDGYPLGFVDDVSPIGIKTMGAAQQIWIPPGTPRIFGLGQVAGSFAAHGHTQFDPGTGPTGDIRQPEWEARLYILSGTWIYDPADGVNATDGLPKHMPRIDINHINSTHASLLYHKPFDPETSAFYKRPDNVTFAHTFGPIPEPASLALLTLAGLALSRRHA